MAEIVIPRLTIDRFPTSPVRARSVGPPSPLAQQSSWQPILTGICPDSPNKRLKQCPDTPQKTPISARLRHQLQQQQQQQQMTDEDFAPMTDVECVCDSRTGNPCLSPSCCQLSIQQQLSMSGRSGRSLFSSASERGAPPSPSPSRRPLFGSSSPTRSVRAQAQINPFSPELLGGSRLSTNSHDSFADDGTTPK